MKRRLLNLLTALSLLLCVAACALWVRSYWRYDHAEFKAAAAGGAPCFGAAVWSANGRGTCCWSQTPARKDRSRELYAYSRPDVARYDGLQSAYCKPMLQHGIAGAACGRWQNTSGRASWGVVVLPYWMVLSPLTILPVLRGGAVAIALRRKRAGRCQLCGYDLTGNVSGVCPECGAAS